MLKICDTVLFMFSLIVNMPNTRGEGCFQSIPTISFVEACPTDFPEWTKGKERKQCHMVAQNCTVKSKFEYHCLFTKPLGVFFELCAPTKVIVGHHCPFYDLEHNSIEPNFDRPCKNHIEQYCPVVYNSSSIYKYGECYSEISGKTERKKVKDELALICNEVDVTLFDKGFYLICVLLGVLIVLLLIHLCCPRCCYKENKRIYQRCIRRKSSAMNIEECQLEIRNQSAEKP